MSRASLVQRLLGTILMVAALNVPPLLWPRTSAAIDCSFTEPVFLRPTPMNFTDPVTAETGFQSRADDVTRSNACGPLLALNDKGEIDYGQVYHVALIARLKYAHDFPND